jgi:hypothetical protein
MLACVYGGASTELFQQIGKLSAFGCAGFTEHSAKPATGQGVTLRRQVNLARGPGYLAIDLELVQIGLKFSVALFDNFQVYDPQLVVVLQR